MITWMNYPGAMHGWGNGYVLIPEGHKLHGMSYDNIHEKYPDLKVHCGLTFSSLVDTEMINEWPELSKEDEGGWLVGFDTCHYQDDIERWPMEAVQAEADKLMMQLNKL